jgi:hypothetical protein
MRASGSLSGPKNIIMITDMRINSKKPIPNTKKPLNKFLAAAHFIQKFIKKYLF